MKCEEGVPIYRLITASLLRSQSVVLVIVRIGGVFVFRRGCCFINCSMTSTAFSSCGSWPSRTSAGSYSTS